MAQPKLTVEVVVWGGILVPFNPFGHVSTLITSSDGHSFSFSTDDEAKGALTCNTVSFSSLAHQEMKIRNGYGLVLDLTEEQAKKVFTYMNKAFHAYKSGHCEYHAISHNCTNEIQGALEQAGVNINGLLRDNIEGGALSSVYTGIDLATKSSNKTVFPMTLATILMHASVHGHKLVKDLYLYRGHNKIIVNSSELKLDITSHFKKHHNCYFVPYDGGANCTPN